MPRSSCFCTYTVTLATSWQYTFNNQRDSPPLSISAHMRSRAALLPATCLLSSSSVHCYRDHPFWRARANKILSNTDREKFSVSEAQSAPRLTDHDDACEDGPRTPSFVLRMSSVFAIEATVGDVIIRLSTGNNESFTLKRSAKEFHVDFSCFTGTLCITSSSNDDNSYFESYSTPPLSEELLMNSNTTECSLPERALPKDAVESVGHDEGSAKSDGEDIHGILKGESSETKGPTIESFTKKTRFHESVNESEAFQSCKEALPIRESAVRSYRETFHEGSIRSVDSRRNLCVQLKDRIDQYESFRDFISSTVACFVV